MIQEHSYVLAVPDLARSGAFYRDVLGFEIHEMASGRQLFVKDSCRIMAGECRDAMPARDTGVHSFFGYLLVDDVDEYHRRVVAGSAEIVKPLEAPLPGATVALWGASAIGAAAVALAFYAVARLNFAGTRHLQGEIERLDKALQPEAGRGE